VLSLIVQGASRAGARTAASLDANRELGVVIDDTGAVARVAATIGDDWAHAREP